LIKKDFNAICVAQGLMDGATLLLNQEQFAHWKAKLKKLTKGNLA
jgi:hypothetical protein